MAKKTTKQEQLKKQYQKERRRIQNYVSRAKRQGWQIESDILPKVPKRITESSVRRLKRITPKEIQKKYSGFVDFETGEILTVAEAKEREKAKRKERRKRKKEDEPIFVDGREVAEEEVAPVPFDIIDRIIGFIDEIPNDRYFRGGARYFVDDKQELKSLVYDNLNEKGESYIAYLKYKESKIASLCSVIMYDSEQSHVDFAIPELMLLLNEEQTLTQYVNEIASSISEKMGDIQ